MSIQMRQWIVSHPNTAFQKQSQRDDLLNPSVTQTNLIAAIEYLVKRGWIICFTAIVSDHHNDEADCTSGPPYCGTHEHGWAADLWPMSNTNIPSGYLDAGDPLFQKFLSDCAHAPYLHQVGLGGSSYSPINVFAAGPTAFEDSNADHVHLGTQT